VGHGRKGRSITGNNLGAVSIDDALRYALVAAWDDFAAIAPPKAVRVEYLREPSSCLENVTIGVLSPGGYQDGFCDYRSGQFSKHQREWRCWSKKHSPQLFRALDFAVRHQDYFLFARDASAHGVVIVFPPTPQERAEAQLGMTAVTDADFTPLQRAPRHSLTVRSVRSSTLRSSACCAVSVAAELLQTCDSQMIWSPGNVTRITAAGSGLFQSCGDSSSRWNGEVPMQTTTEVTRLGLPPSADFRELSFASERGLSCVHCGTLMKLESPLKDLIRHVSPIWCPMCLREAPYCADDLVDL
jgi:hypothetical protein